LNLIIFEDGQADGFYPLSVSHPVFDLFYGCLDTVDRLRKFFKAENIYLVCREYLADIIRLKFSYPVNDLNSGGDEFLLINAAIKPDKDVFNRLLSLPPGSACYCDNRLACARVSSGLMDKIKISRLLNSDDDFSGLLKKVDIEVSLFKHLWEIVDFNSRAIEFDLAYAGNFGKFAKGNKLAGMDKNVYMHPSAKIGRGAYFDTSDGPIIIDENAVIQPRTLVQGPAYIGKGSQLLGGIIREGSSLGPVCKAGGELEATVIQGYSNKAHEGFIGHAYIGEWVNLGALTTNSDLKNNYGEITVRLQGIDVASGSIKVGSFIGDHTKTGIGTLLNTGIVVGFCCNLYGGSLFAEKEIGHFRWGIPGNLVDFKIGKAVEIARSVMARRKVQFTEIHEKLFEQISGSDELD
jgi:UDP-N-acetylglucosamine diphosphorylase/glucosamine-1-phosphate N-acetyltransferase